MRDQVKSAARALAILEHFSEVRRPLGLQELTELTGYPQSSTAFLLKTLVSLGYLNYNRSTRIYFPTPRVSRLGDWIERSLDGALYGDGPLPRLMRELQATTTEDVVVAVRNDLSVQMLRILGSQHAIRFHRPEGSMLPLTRSNYGIILLSKEPAEAVERTCRLINARAGSDTDKVDFRRLSASLEAARRQGYAYVPHIPVLGSAAITMMLPGLALGQPLALGVAGLVDRLEPQRERIVGLMREAIGRYGPAVEAALAASWDWGG